MIATNSIYINIYISKCNSFLVDSIDLLGIYWFGL